MKEVTLPMVLIDTVHTWQRVRMPKGYLQHIIFEMSNILGNNDIHIFGLSRKERITGFVPTPIVGGMLLFEKQNLYIVTSGGQVLKSRTPYKLGNLKFDVPTYLYVYILNNSGGDESCLVRLQYTEKELQEVV